MGALKIFVGTAEIAKSVMNLSKGFRELGHHVDNFVGRTSKWYKDAEYVLSPVDFSSDINLSLLDDGTVTFEHGSKFGDFVNNYDMFIFVAGTSLLPRMIDLPVIKQLGKTVIAFHCGTEVRDTHLAEMFWNSYGRSYGYYESDINTPRVTIHTEEDVLKHGRYQPTLANKMHNIRSSELNADLIACGPSSNTLGIRPYTQTGPVIDLETSSFKIPGRRVPIIVHAPTSPEFKRTDEILAMLQELKEEGLRFHLQLLQNLPNEIVLQKLADADIVIDQLACGCGLLAFEAAAAGCAVLGGHDGVSSPLPRNRPILHVTPDNFKERVRKVVEDVKYRTRLAEMGREYIIAGISSPAGVATALLDALERSNKGDHDIYPTLFVEKAHAHEDEYIPEYLKQRTFEILKKCGVHPEADLRRLEVEGLIPSLGEDDISMVPRWDASKLTQEGPWVFTGPSAALSTQNFLPDYC